MPCNGRDRTPRVLRTCDTDLDQDRLRCTRAQHGNHLAVSLSSRYADVGNVWSCIRCEVEVAKRLCQANGLVIEHAKWFLSVVRQDQMFDMQNHDISLCFHDVSFGS